MLRMNAAMLVILPLVVAFLFFAMAVAARHRHPFLAIVNALCVVANLANLKSQIRLARQLREMP
jgi:hypothetical protein